MMTPAWKFRGEGRPGLRAGAGGQKVGSSSAFGVSGFFRCIFQLPSDIDWQSSHSWARGSYLLLRG